MPGSCSSGFRSRPSAAGGNRRSNGSDVVSMKSRKPNDTRPCTPSTRATISSGRCFEKTETARVHHASISTHSSSEPSCEPQLAATLYCTGSCELEFWATFSTEKSLVTNEYSEAQPRERHEERLAARRGPRHRHPHAVAARGAGDGQHALDQREQERQDQREVTDFRNHGLGLLVRCAV